MTYGKVQPSPSACWQDIVRQIPRLLHPALREFLTELFRCFHRRYQEDINRRGLPEHMY
jgi:hypothetical protein